MSHVFCISFLFLNFITTFQSSSACISSNTYIFKSTVTCFMFTVWVKCVFTNKCQLELCYKRVFVWCVKAINFHKDLYLYLRACTSLKSTWKIECFLKKSLKIKSVMISAGESLLVLEKSLNFTFFFRT